MKLSRLQFLCFVGAGIAAPVFVGGLAIHAANAQDAESESFQGKTLTIAFGAPDGGVLDLQARFVGRFIAQHIPGKPSVVISAMPGAGSKVLARHLANIAPKDGTFIGVPFTNALIDPLLSGDKDPGYDASKFAYLGNSNSDVPLCMVSKSAPVQSLPDILQTEVFTAVSQPGGPTYDFPAIADGLLGARFHLVKGYAGGQDVALALQRGEVQAICGSWSQIKVRYPDILKGTMDFRVFVQEDSGRGSELAKAGIPSLASLADKDLDRQALRFFMTEFVISSPFVLPPGVPPKVVQTLRKAFSDTMSDPDLLAEAKRLNVDVSYMSGEDVQGMLSQVYQTSPEIVVRVKTALAKVQ
jgi:tripartite-type tricarboxylate transporter receptor subunit TctC